MKSVNATVCARAVSTFVLIVWAGLVQAQAVTVDSVVPSSAEQGTVGLEVEISGNGFDSSAAVDFFVTGTTSPGGITVKSIKVRGSRKIIATIDVDLAAFVADFDIEVRLSNGRKGKGTTLFKVQAKANAKPSDEYTSTGTGVQFISPSDVAGFDYHIVGTAEGEDIIAGSGRDLIEGGGSRDYIYARSNDDVVHGGEGGDILEGGEGNDVLYGEEGEDYLAGGLGTDVLDGGIGFDFLDFSLGRFDGSAYELDVFDGGADLDAIRFGYSPEVVGVVVDLALSTYSATADTPDLGIVQIEGSFVGIESVWGSEGNDLLLGTNGDDSFSGNGSFGPEDFGGLFGFGGDDEIYGFGGNDVISGDLGNDVVFGGAGNDQLLGYAGADVIDGGEGSDLLRLGFDDGSADLISGGPGCDYFEFSGSFGTDAITDFDDSCELIDLSWYTQRYRMKFSNLTILTSGSDIVISFWYSKLGGAGGTIVLKDGVASGISVSPSMFVF